MADDDKWQVIDYVKYKWDASHRELIPGWYILLEVENILSDLVTYC